MPEPTFKDPETVFDEAIASGRLSDTPGAENYAGRYMYMGTWDGVDAFKHIDTREYLVDVSAIACGSGHELKPNDLVSRQRKPRSLTKEPHGSICKDNTKR